MRPRAPFSKSVKFLCFYFAVDLCDQALRLKFSTKREIRAPHRENGSLTRLKTSTFIEGIDRKAGYWPITISGTTVSENNVDVSKTNVEMLSSFN